MAIPTSHALAAVWSDDALYFCTGPGEQKYANLRADPHVILMTAATCLVEVHCPAMPVMWHAT